MSENTQDELVVIRVYRSTRERLKSIRLTKRESYDEIINRLLDLYEEVTKHERGRRVRGKNKRY